WSSDVCSSDLRQLGTAQHAVAGLKQYREHSGLGAAERDLPAGGLFQGAGDRVEPPAAEGEAADALGARISGRVSGAAQDRLDPSEELAWIEGLRQAVIRAELEPDDAVDVLAARGQHDDRHLRAAAA